MPKRYIYSCNLCGKDVDHNQTQVLAFALNPKGAMILQNKLENGDIFVCTGCVAVIVNSPVGKQVGR